MDKWTRIRRDILVEKMSRREACRKYNLNFRTIQKILKHPEPPEKPKEYARADSTAVDRCAVAEEARADPARAL
jgi:hypothetical protein